MAERKPLQGVLQRRRPDGTRLPGWWCRYEKADGKRTVVYAAATRRDAEVFGRRRLAEVEEEKALPPEDRVRRPL
jgi:hypothetical protein